MTKTVQVTIQGLCPMLMHAYPMTPVEAMEKKTPEEQAELAAHRIPGSRNLFVPGDAVYRALVAGATYSKGKGRGSLSKFAAASFNIPHEYLDLGATEYAIDSRPVVMPSTKGRVMRHRPRLDQWRISFPLEYDDTLFSAKQVRQIVDDTGTRVGLLDHRPKYGKFVVIRWEEVQLAAAA